MVDLKHLAQVLCRVSNLKIVAVNTWGRCEFPILYFIVLEWPLLDDFCVLLFLLLPSVLYSSASEHSLFSLGHGVVQKGYPLTTQPGAVGRGWSAGPQKHWQT